MPIPWKIRSQLMILVKDANCDQPASDIAEMWNRRFPHRRIDGEVVQRIRRQCGLTQREEDPTPQQIAMRAEEERTNWTKYDFWKRSQYHALPWTVPGAENIQREDDAVREMLDDGREDSTEGG